MDNNKKLKLRITALTLASTLILNGCGVNNKFKITENENNEIVSLAGSYISKNYINDYYVLELFNNLTNENELFIARKKGTNINRKYYDVFTNFKIYEEYDELKEDSLFKFIKDSELTDYIVALGLEQVEYSYDDMKNIYDVIKEYYVFSDNSSLKKRILDNRI